jgi:hypothetical protein
MSHHTRCWFGLRAALRTSVSAQEAMPATMCRKQTNEPTPLVWGGGRLVCGSVHLSRPTSLVRPIPSQTGGQTVRRTEKVKTNPALFIINRTARTAWARQSG